MTKAQQRKLQWGILISLLVMLLVGSLHYQHLFQRLEWISYDHRMRLFRAEQPAHPDIAVVLIDESSLQAMDPLVGRFPWPRSVYADVLEFFSYGEPRAILFDILFTERQSATQQDAPLNTHDRQLIAATRASGNVYHSAQLMQIEQDEKQDASLNRPLPDGFKTRFALDQPAFPLDHHTNSYTIPFDGLYQAAAGIGTVDMNADADGIFRRVRPFRFYQQAAYPTLSLASLHQPDKPLQRHSANRLHWNGQEIPLLPDGTLPVNMVGRFDSYSIGGLLASMQQIRQGQVQNLLVHPDEFRDKIVFIGASAVGLEDIKATPVSHRAPGVYIHASATSNLLSGNYLTPAAPTLIYLAIALFAGLTTASILLSNQLYTQLGWPILWAAGYTLWNYWLFSQNQWWELIPPLAAIILTAALSLIYLTATEGKDKRRIRKMLSQYVSPAILAEMVDNHDSIATAEIGTSENLTILFSDVRGFTSLSETLPAEQVVDLLNIHLGLMCDIIFEQEGTLDKFIGDAIMAFWGAPLRVENHADKALIAAIRMARGMDEVNRRLAEKGYPPIQIGIGLHSGEVVLGNIGSNKKLDYTIIGDNVNLASRMEGLTKQYGCSILISENTKTMLTQPIPCAQIDLVRVKGKHRPTALYQPLALPDEPPEQLRQAQATAELSERAFAAYLERRWDRAIALFRQLPESKARDMLLARCEDYRQMELPAEWDGVHTLSSK